MRREREQYPAQADIDYIAAESRLAVPDKAAESVEPVVPFSSAVDMDFAVCNH